MRSVADHHAIDPVRVQDPEEHRRPAAPVVSDDVRALDPERVEQRHLVGCERLAVVAVARRLGPAEARAGRARGGGTHRQGGRSPGATCTSAAGQPWRSRTAGASAGPASATWIADPVRIDEAVLDALDCGNVVGHSSAIYSRIGGHRAREGGIGSAEMAKERLKSPRARLFVALDLPDASARGSSRLAARGR